MDNSLWVVLSRPRGVRTLLRGNRTVIETSFSTQNCPTDEQLESYIRAAGISREIVLCEVRQIRRLNNNPIEIVDAKDLR